MLMRARDYLAAVILALFGACVLASCAPAGMGDQLSPALGGLPTDAPARPAAPYEYPAVHDMPPPRSDTPMSEDQLLRMQKDLAAIRDRTEGLNDQASKQAAKPGTKPSGKPKTAEKKKPSDPNAGRAAGAKTNP
ncbi:MAG: hypothetical protein WA792_05275 [Pseudolabrys sp.]|jgi:hypothetical protein